MTRSLLATGLLAAAAPAFADDPRPTPLTRPEMKRLLEDMKGRTPRIPLPPLTAEERERYGDRADAAYESRLRTLFMPWAGGGAGGRAGAGGPLGFGGQPGGGNADPAMTLDYPFKTQLFWIVSRANNCQYCLGHQESKLLNAGMSEDEIAALDGDWVGLTPRQQAAYAFARRFTLEPHKLSDADVAGLRRHFTDLQILEMVLSMAGNNQINRWKEGVGVPQGRGGFGRRSGAEAAKAERPKEDKPHTYDTPTSDAFKTKVTKVAAVADGATGVTCPTVCVRPPLPPAEAGLATARARTPRLPLVDEAKAKEVVGDGPTPQWVRLLAHFPVAGKARVAAQRTAEEKGDLSPLTKAQVAWIVARQDRAWYAADEARGRLVALGQTDADIARLDGDWKEFSPADRARFTLAKHLAASPVVLTDSEVAEAVKQIGPRDTVQLISYVTVRASFDRITEAAGLTAGQ